MLIKNILHLHKGSTLEDVLKRLIRSKISTNKGERYILYIKNLSIAFYIYLLKELSPIFYIWKYVKSHLLDKLNFLGIVVKLQKKIIDDKTIFLNSSYLNTLNKMLKIIDVNLKVSTINELYIISKLYQTISFLY